MNKLVVFGTDGIIFDLAPRESTFDYLLSALGKSEEAKKITEKYLQGKSKGPLLLADKVELFKGVKAAELRKLSEDYVNRKTRPDFRDCIKEIKNRGYSIAIFTSNPITPVQILKEKHHDIDFVFGTELEEKNGIYTGKYVLLSFPQEIEEAYKKMHPSLAEKATTEPNRYGLAEKLFQLVKENKIDADKSWLVWNKVTRLPMAEIIKNTIAFGVSDTKMEKAVKYKVEGKALAEVLQYIK